MNLGKTTGDKVYYKGLSPMVEKTWCDIVATVEYNIIRDIDTKSDNLKTNIFIDKII